MADSIGQLAERYVDATLHSNGYLGSNTIQTVLNAVNNTHSFEAFDAVLASKLTPEEHLYLQQKYPGVSWTAAKLLMESSEQVLGESSIFGIGHSFAVAGNQNLPETPCIEGAVDTFDVLKGDKLVTGGAFAVVGLAFGAIIFFPGTIAALVGTGVVGGLSLFGVVYGTIKLSDGGSRYMLARISHQSKRVRVET